MQIIQAMACFDLSQKAKKGMACCDLLVNSNAIIYWRKIPREMETKRRKGTRDFLTSGPLLSLDTCAKDFHGDKLNSKMGPIR